MGLKKYIRKYKNYEIEELKRRAAKKKKVAAYKSLMKAGKKKRLVKKVRRKFNAKAFTKALGNPYGVKL